MRSISCAQLRWMRCGRRGPNKHPSGFSVGGGSSFNFLQNHRQRCFCTTPNRCEFGANLSTTQHNEKGIKKRHTVGIPLCGVVLSGGADATGIQPTLSTIEQSRAILRVVVDAMASAMNAGQSVQGGLSPCAAPIDR